MSIRVRALLDELDLSRVIGAHVALQKIGREYKGLCPFHDDHDPSLTVIPAKRFAHCFACGWNGNAIDFVMQFKGVGFKDAARFLIKQYSNGAVHEAPLIPPAVKSKAVGDLYHSEVPPKNTPRPAMRLTRFGAPVAVWEYKTADGIVQGYVARYDDRKRKIVFCWSWGADYPEDPASNATPKLPSWHLKHFSRPRPLYGLELLAQVGPSDKIVIVEGEKTADAARLLFSTADCVVVTWPGGCPGIRHADWRPLAGRDVILIPDADDAGKKAMAWLGEHLMGKEHAADVFVPRAARLRTAVPEEDRPQGWDLADIDWSPKDALEWFAARVQVWEKSELRAFVGEQQNYSTGVPEPADPLTTAAGEPPPDDLPPVGAYEVDVSKLDEAPRYSKPAGEPLDWHGLSQQRPPERDWAILHWLGMGHVTLLAGPGGAGKSLLAQTIASALSVGTNYVGTIERPRRVLYWACEDDHDELWRRQVDIGDYLKTRLIDFENLVLVPRRGQDNGLLEVTRDGLAWRKPMDELVEMVNEYNADVLFLDTVAQLCGDEINRHAVTTFTNRFCGLRAGLATVLIAHPSKQIGSEYSGSTAWENGVRMRWYLGNKLPAETMVGPADEEVPDEEIRWLCKRKANYTSRDYVKLRYENGVFIPEFVTDQGFVSASMRGVAEAIVMKALEDFHGMGRITTDSSNSPDFLPRLIFKFNLQQNCTKKIITEAMYDLQKAGRIKRGVAGTYDNRRPRMGLIVSDPAASGDTK